MYKKNRVLATLGKKQKFIRFIMTSLLNFVVDSLDLRILSLSSVHESIHTSLESWRSHQENYVHGETPPLQVLIPGLGSFTLLHHSTRPYAFTLVNPQIADIRIWNPDKNAQAVSTQTGQLYVNFRSVFLQEFTLDVVDPAIHALKTWFFSDPSAPGFVRVSRADLAADISYRQLSWSDLDRFVTKARKFDTFAVDSLQQQLNNAIGLLQSPPLDNKGGSNCTDSAVAILQNIQKSLNQRLSDSSLSRVVSTNNPETIYFGRFGGDLYARIYDKTASLSVQGKEYLRDIWSQAGWDGVTPVLRVEFSLSGDFLKNTELLGVCDHRAFDWFVKVIPNLWHYLTTDWLRHTEPSSDLTRSRWPISEFWAEVQTACESAPQIVRAKAPRCTLEQPLTSGLRGYFTSLVSKATLVSDHIYDVAIEQIFKLSQYIETNRFLSDVETKRLSLGTDDFSISNQLDRYSDSQFSALVRQEVISRGKGS
jgi:hypothetical protein